MQNSSCSLWIFSAYYLVKAKHTHSVSKVVSKAATRTKGKAGVLTGLCQVKRTELISFPGILKKDYMLFKNTFYPTGEKNLTNKWLMSPKKVLSPGLVIGHKCHYGRVQNQPIIIASLPAAKCLFLSCRTGLLLTQLLLQHASEVVGMSSHWLSL